MESTIGQITSELDQGQSGCAIAYNKGSVFTIRSAMDLRRASQILGNPKPGAGEAYLARKVIDHLKDRVPSAEFALANALTRRGCLREADQIYRSMLSFYVGGEQQAIRDRVQVAIEDVREIRARD